VVTGNAFRIGEEYALVTGIQEISKSNLGHPLILCMAGTSVVKNHMRDNTHTVDMAYHPQLVFSKDNIFWTVVSQPMATF